MFQNKRELTFLIIGILMFLLVIVGLVYSIQFLATKLNRGLNPKEAEVSGTVLRFNVDKAKALVK